MLVSCVPMREQKKKTMRKGTFFQAGQCAALSSFRVGKMLFFLGKGYVFYKFFKRLQNKRVCVLIYYIGKGYFLTGQSEKGYQFQNVEHTV